MAKPLNIVSKASKGALVYFNSLRGPVLCRIHEAHCAGWTLRVEKSVGAYDAGHIFTTSETWCIPYKALKRDGIHIRPYKWEYEA